MASSGKILDQMRREPNNVRFADLKKLCESYFGKSRQTGTSHAIFKTPWVVAVLYWRDSRSATLATLAGPVTGKGLP